MKRLLMARDVGFEPTRPFDHRLSRPAPYQARAIPHSRMFFEVCRSSGYIVDCGGSDIFAFCMLKTTKSTILAEGG